MLTNELLDRVLHLPHEERVRFVREIIASLDGETDADREAAWASEIARRVGEVRDGSADLMDWQTVKHRIEARLSSRR